MNNEQFRKLLASGPATIRSGESEAGYASQQHSRPSSKKAGLVALAPRNVRSFAGATYARQAQTSEKTQRSTKRFKSSTPKGSSVASGYVDRVKARLEAEETEDDKATRIQALEDKVKTGDLSIKEFEALREDITAGDVSSTHLVKGLDRKLLERVRRGEDVLGLTATAEAHDDNVDDELDKLASTEVDTVHKDKVDKQGNAAPAAQAGKKRTRDEIMAELKAQRRAAAEAQTVDEPELDLKWRRVDDKQKSRIEIDRKGREVLVTVDEDGTVKRKVRKVAHSRADEPTVQLDPSKDVLGADAAISIAFTKQQDAAAVGDDDGDIFEGVGTDYDPLGPDIDSDGEDTAPRDRIQENQDPDTNSHERNPALINQPKQKRDYFNERGSAREEKSSDHLAGIKAIVVKAAKLAPKDEQPLEDDVETARRAKHAKMLANRDRDLDDMDLGFGGSRLADDEDGDAGGERIRLSEWKGGDHDNDDDHHHHDVQHSEKKKRKPKRRKGDANSISDIMGVIERRKDRS